MFNTNNSFKLGNEVITRLKLISSHDITKLNHIKTLGFYPIGYVYRNDISTQDFNGISGEVEVQYTNNFEKLLFDNNKIPADNMWKYSINEYNFRDTWDLSKTDSKKIGCFGDSFTFGDGLPSHELHVNYLSSILNMRTFNVGMGGSSAERVARTFSIFSKFVQIDVAVFTFPSIYREFFIDPSGRIRNLIPNNSGNDEKYMKEFFGLHENYQLVKLSLNINYILDIAEERKIKVLFTSWDPPTYDILKTVAPSNCMSEIFPNTLDQRSARDLQHPGKKSQYKHAENIAKELYDRTWI
jgi:hypothetical protein